MRKTKTSPTNPPPSSTPPIGDLRGRGAHINTVNPFSKLTLVQEHIEGIDLPLLTNPLTQTFADNARTIVNKQKSPDINMLNTINPYQGCEHGCIYCYARNSHTYYGFSAGIDFETKIMVKHHAAQLLRAHFNHPRYVVQPITLSGNTDCYQPIEAQLKITRSLLQVMLEYKNPVGIITKNSLVLRDIDLLQELARYNLVHVMVSITSLSEELRLAMEPRTVTARKRLHLIEQLSKHRIPVGVMTAPIIPGLNSHEIPQLIKEAAAHGASDAGYTIVRLNGEIHHIFYEWLHRTMPHAATKIWNQIKECHGGQVNDSRFGTRMKGEGNIAQSINQLFKLAKHKYMHGLKFPAYDTSHFKRPIINGQLQLF